MACFVENGKQVRTIEYHPWPSQRLFHDSRKRWKGFSGPIGSGKSLALAHEALRLSAANAGCLGLIAAPTYPMLRDITMRHVFDVLGDSGIPYRYNQQAHEVSLTEVGSKIIFRSTTDYENLRGTNLAWFGIDEMTFTKQEAFLRLQGRVREPKAEELCGFGVWTPNGFDWVYETFIAPDHHPDYEAILGSPGENEALAEGYYEHLARSYDERFYRQEVLGEYLNIRSGQAYYAFDRTLNINPCVYVPGRTFCWTLDFNIDPMCSVIFQIEDTTTALDAAYGRRTANVWVIDELYLPNTQTHDACRVFVERVRQMVGPRAATLPVRVYGDPAGNNRQHASAADWAVVKEYFRSIPDIRPEYHVKAQAPPVKDRIAAVNAKLCNAKGQRSLFINPKCRELIRDFEQVSWKFDSAGRSLGDIDDSVKARTHLSDALGYAIEVEFGLTRQQGGPRSDGYGGW